EHLHARDSQEADDEPDHDRDHERPHGERDRHHRPVQERRQEETEVAREPFDQLAIRWPTPQPSRIFLSCPLAFSFLSEPLIASSSSLSPLFTASPIFHALTGV